MHSFERSIIYRCYVSRRLGGEQYISRRFCVFSTSHAAGAIQVERPRFELACNFADGRTRARCSDPTRKSSRAGLIAHANPFGGASGVDAARVPMRRIRREKRGPILLSDLGSPLRSEVIDRSLWMAKRRDRGMTGYGPRGCRVRTTLLRCRVIS